MTDSEVDTERTTVRTYVPAYQRDAWDEHAEELGMSRSEFVRSMVQAGRRNFGTDGAGADSNGGSVERDGPDLESRVLDVLESADFLTWDELVARLTDDVEDRLETTLDDLQAADRIRYSGRNGGYTIREQ